MIGPNGIAVYNALCMRANKKTGESWPSRESIHEVTGLSVRAISASINLLAQYGLITIERTTGGPNHYFIQPVPEATAPLQQMQAPTPALRARGIARHASPLAPDAIPLAPRAAEQESETRIKNKNQEQTFAADAASDPTPPRKPRRPKTSEPDAPDKPKELTPQQTLVKAFGETMHINPTLNAGKIARLIADLRKSGPDPTLALVEEKYTRPDSWHYRHDWRGKQGQPPNFASIRESWGVWAEAAPPPGNGTAKPRRVLGPSMLDLRREREAAAEAERRKRHGIPNDDNGSTGHLRGAVAI
jgi:hypothetical protein